MCEVEIKSGEDGDRRCDEVGVPLLKMAEDNLEIRSCGKVRTGHLLPGSGGGTAGTSGFSSCQPQAIVDTTSRMGVIQERHLSTLIAPYSASSSLIHSIIFVPSRPMTYVRLIRKGERLGIDLMGCGGIMKSSREWASGIILSRAGISSQLHIYKPCQVIVYT